MAKSHTYVHSVLILILLKLSPELVIVYSWVINFSLLHDQTVMSVITVHVKWHTHSFPMSVVLYAFACSETFTSNKKLHRWVSYPGNVIDQVHNHVNKIKWFNCVNRLQLLQYQFLLTSHHPVENYTISPSP